MPKNIPNSRFNNLYINVRFCIAVFKFNLRMINLMFNFRLKVLRVYITSRPTKIYNIMFCAKIINKALWWVEMYWFELREEISDDIFFLYRKIIFLLYSKTYFSKCGLVNFQWDFNWFQYCPISNFKTVAISSAT